MQKESFIHADAPRIIRANSASFSFASYLFPRKVRTATHVLYAFLRTCDDVVDAKDADRASLDQLRAEFLGAYHEQKDDGSLPSAAAIVFRTYSIPVVLMTDFFETMEGDMTFTQPQTFDDLKKYLYGVAGTVGLMMTHIIGYKNEDALVHAQALGEGMQLVNILRDIKEDYDALGRVYLPAKDLEKYSISVEDIRTAHFTESFELLMKEYSRQARKMFDVGEKGISMLPRRGQLPVRLASKIYSAILEEIARQGYNPFCGRARTSGVKKFSLLIQSLFMI